MNLIEMAAQMKQKKRENLRNHCYHLEPLHFSDLVANYQRTIFLLLLLPNRTRCLCYIILNLKTVKYWR